MVNDYSFSGWGNADGLERAKEFLHEEGVTVQSAELDVERGAFEIHGQCDALTANSLNEGREFVVKPYEAKKPSSGMAGPG